TVTIHGTNDVPVIGGAATGAVTEDISDEHSAELQTRGPLTIAHLHQRQSTFTAQPSTAGTYGTFTLDAAGNWTYTAADSQAAIQQLGAVQCIADSCAVLSFPTRRSSDLTVTIHGTNDVPVIGGAATGAVTED